MKVLVLSNAELKPREIGAELEDLQRIVDGYIEIPFLSEIFYENGIDIIINEEGKLIEGMRPEIAIVKNGTTQILDIIYGNCIFASHDEEGNTIELNEKQIQIVEKELRMEVILYDKNKDEHMPVRVMFI